MIQKLKNVFDRYVVTLGRSPEQFENLKTTDEVIANYIKREKKINFDCLMTLSLIVRMYSY